MRGEEVDQVVIAVDVVDADPEYQQRSAAPAMRTLMLYVTFGSPPDCSVMRWFSFMLGSEGGPFDAWMNYSSEEAILCVTRRVQRWPYD
ncbi:hypothetical protein [Sorangium sp. So ce1182]|uniref:hypothetical protein n=1 Tax=Sorangium sp. So ce1182 TaxID=3133334 RepID=UPI003F5DCD5E